MPHVQPFDNTIYNPSEVCVTKSIANDVQTKKERLAISQMSKLYV